MVKDDVFDIKPRRRRAEHVVKDLDMRKVGGGVFEVNALKSLGRLAEKGVLDHLVSPVSTGKEADVFIGVDEAGKRVAVKIFRLASSSYFKRPTVLQYILGDERFKDIKKDTRSIIMAWAQKEFRNLKLAEGMGIHAPKPLGIEKNVLVMEFLGETDSEGGGKSGREDEDARAAPRMKDVNLEDPEGVAKTIFADVKTMAKKKFVHADLSEYNILMPGDVPYIIDFSQGVLTTHPNAREFLRRDVQNLCNYFSKLGVECDAEETYKEIGHGIAISKDTQR